MRKAKTTTSTIFWFLEGRDPNWEGNYLNSDIFKVRKHPRNIFDIFRVVETNRIKSNTYRGKVESFIFFVEASVSPTSHQAQAATHQTQKTYTPGWMMIK
jgi:hypothetical protein